MELRIAIDAAPGEVWAELSDLGSHADWMKDASSIEFVTNQRSGEGTEMRVPTRVGPLRTNDLMTVTVWHEERRIGVAHRGLVSGEGLFEIESHGDRSVLIWTEKLRFPWWLGGPLAAFLAGPVLRAIWRGNLRRFKDRVEAASGP